MTSPTPGGHAMATDIPLVHKHAKIYPRSVSGTFATWRWIFVWLTQIVFYGGPWLQWDGRQAVLFDLVERRFYLFGLVLQPQDLIYLTALLVLSALLLFFFTAVAGRLWCGYACPQTVYTSIFMWIEKHLEGDRGRRMRLDASPWGVEKALRKSGKQAAWWGFSLITGFTFVGYFTPIHTLAAETAALSFSAWEWFWILFYAAATYGNAGFLREQMCKQICPYARFQSALIDADSLVIAYDRERGEPRGARSRKADPAALGLGSCVDCTLCVQVCPTGIDIRNGLQNECIGCAACIDVCDDVMDKLGYPRGLVRYATGNGMTQHWSRGQMLRRVLRPRVLIYGGLLAGLSLAFALSLWGRAPFSVNIIRDRGALARIVDEGAIENVYEVKVSNRTERPQRYRVAARGLDGLHVSSATELAVGPSEIGSLVIRVELPPEQAQTLSTGAHPIQIEVSELAAGGATTRESSTFLLPM